MLRKPKPSLLGISIALASLPGIAQAQAAEDRRATAVEEVIVTARKVEESLQDTPVSVAAFSEDALEQIGVSEAADVSNFTPNMRIQKQTASQDNYAIAVRGVSSGETALAIDPTVGIYMDGVYIARSTGAAFDLVDLQRIEVLRGPQGALFGRNTIGGAINIVTAKPRGEFAFKQAVTYGSRDHRRYQTTIDTPEWNGVAAKLSWMADRGDGDRESVYTGGDLGGFDNTAMRLRLNWSPNEQWTLDYAYDKSDKEGNTATSQLSHVRPTYASPFSPVYGGDYYDKASAAADPERRGKLPSKNDNIGETNSDIDGHSIVSSFDLSDNVNLKTIVAYREWKSKSRSTEFGSFPSDGATLIDSGTGLPVPAGELVSIFAAQRDSAQRQTTFEQQISGFAMEERLQYLAGLYYFEETSDEVNPQSFVLPGATLPPPFTTPPGVSILLRRPFFAYGTDNQSYAVFGQATYNLSTDLDITIGGRYTVDKKETTLTNTLGGATTPSTIVDDESWSNFNPSFSVNYRWSEELSTYFRFATGYRSGGYNVRSSNEAAFRQPFDEENITSYELGWKSDLLDRKLRLNGSLFHLVYEDRQIAQFEAGSGGASTRIVNAGESETSGLELEAIYIPTAGLRLMATYGYLDVNYKEFFTGVVDPVTGFPTGQNRDISDIASESLYAPENTGSLALEYTFAPMDLGDLMFRIDSTYVDEMTYHPQFTLYDKQDDYSLTNARLTLSNVDAGDGKLKVSLWGKNLGNEEYREFGIDFGQLGFAVNTYGPLRTWGLDLAWEFNRD